MSTLITILHVIVCLFLMLTVLLQSGKGGGMGAAFGGGNAATVFGGSGASQFLRRLTAIAGTVFILTSMLLAFLASHNNADALEKFGEQQEKIAAEKEAAKKKALQAGPGSGSAAGSASLMTPFTPNAGSASGSAAPATGSAAPGATPPAAGSAAPAADSAAPAEAPAATPPVAPSAPGAAAPSVAPPASAPAPAAAPQAATPPAATPSPAPKAAAPAAGSNSSK